MIQEGEIIDVAVAAKLLGLHEETLRRMARDGRVPSFKVGRGWRFNRTTLHEWAQAQQQTVRRKHVLVIDDEPLDLELTSLTVEKLGYTAMTANTGPKALQMMQEELPDIVLLDLKMPGMDGPTILREIQKAHSTVPVILITGYPDSDLVSRALVYSPVTLLSKPVEATRLVSVMERAINRGAEGKAS